MQLKSSNKYSLLSTSHELRHQLLSLKDKRVPFQNYSELLTDLDLDQSSCYQISELTRDFDFDIIESYPTMLQKMSGINFSNQQQSRAIKFIDDALAHDRKREVYDEQDADNQSLLCASQISALEFELREIQSKIVSDRQDLQRLVQKKEQTKNQCESIINTKKPVPTEKCPKSYLIVTPKDFREESKQSAATQSTLPENQEYIKIDTLPLHLILMFEQTGRTAMLNL